MGATIMNGYQKAYFVLFGGLIPTTLHCWYVKFSAGLFVEVLGAAAALKQDGCGAGVWVP